MEKVSVLDAKKGVIVKNDSLKGIEPVLNSWVDTVLRYSEVTDGACWWHNERANISILSAAAWRAGWVALEEYGTEKRGEDGNGKYGRCDLWVCNNETTSFAIEAKHAWQPIGGSGISYAAKAFDSAWDDAGNLQRTEASIRIAATFIVPSLAKSQNHYDIESLVSEWLEKVKVTFNFDALAYIYESSAKFSNDEGRVFPGVVLLLQHRMRAASGK